MAGGFNLDAVKSALIKAGRAVKVAVCDKAWPFVKYIACNKVWPFVRHISCDVVWPFVRHVSCDIVWPFLRNVAAKVGPFVKHLCCDIIWPWIKNFCSNIGPWIKHVWNDKLVPFFKGVVWEIKAAPDRTYEFSRNDIDENKVLSMLSYVPVIVLLPFFWPMITKKESRYMKFHARQGLILFIIELVNALVFGLLSLIPVVGFIFTIIKIFIYVCCAALAAKNIWDVLNGKAQDLPYIEKLPKGKAV